MQPIALDVGATGLPERTLFHAKIEVEEVDQLQRAQAAQAVDGGAVAYEHESLAGAQAIAAAGAGAGGALLAGDGASVTTAGSLGVGLLVWVAV